MSGKPPIKIYEYDNKGCFIRQFETLADARKHHYSDDKGLRPLFAGKKSISFGFKIHVTPSKYYTEFIVVKRCWPFEEEKEESFIIEEESN